MGKYTKYAKICKNVKLSWRSPRSYNAHFPSELIQKNVILSFKKYFILTRAENSRVIFVYTWDTFLGHMLK